MATLTLGTAVEGSINPATDVEDWTFDAGAGDRLIIQLGETSVFLDPRLRLVAPSTATLEDEFNTTSLEVNTVLSEAGTHTILVSDNGVDDTGSYSLAAQNITNHTGAIPLTFGDDVTGSINSDADLDTFTFTATAGDRLVLQLGETSVFLDPRVRLFDPSGNTIADQFDTNSLELNTVLDQSGRYTVLISDNGINDTGSYSLAVQNITSTQGTISLPFGDDITGSIDDEAAFDTYTFTATAGDRFMLQLGETSVFLDPRVQILDPSGTTIVNESDTTSLELNTILAQSGTYTVLISDNGINDTGSYSLAAQNITNLSNIIPYTLGNNIEGAIDADAEFDTYTFTAEAGDRILFQLGETSVFLDPRLRILDPSGQTIADESNSTALDLDLSLTQSGTYTVLISDNGINDTGGYSFAAQNISNPQQVTALGFGNNVTNSVDGVAELDTYTFTGNAGDRILTQLAASSVFLDPRIRIVDPSGTTILDETNDAATELNVTLAQSGTYKVLISDSGINDTGDYSFASQNITTPGNVIPLTVGESVAAGIDSAAEFDAYSFTIKEDDRLTLTLTTANGAFDPRLRLIDSNGTIINDQFSDSQLARGINLETLTVPGDYTVLISDAGVDNTGSYQLLIADPTQGTSENDRLTGTRDRDELNGLGGNDRLLGLNGRDVLIGGDGNDTLQGGNGNDVLEGGKGRDILKGGNGKDRLDGGPGNDVLDGGKGNDICDAGGGNDRIRVTQGRDRITTGKGRDRIEVGTKGLAVITDFQDGKDKLKLLGSLRKLDFDDLNIFERGNTVAIAKNQSVIIELKGLDIGDISVADFI